MFPAPSSATPAAAIPVKNGFAMGDSRVVVPFVELALSKASTDPEADPFSAILATAVAAEPPLGVNGTLTVRVADRRPAAEAVTVTATLQSKESSAFCDPQLTVPAVASGVVVSVAAGEDTAPAVVSEM